MAARSLLLLFCLWTSAQAAPVIQHWQTANGARVYFVPAPEIPMVDIQVVFDAGSARDNSKPGLARLTNGLMSEGAGGLSANRIAERFAELGAIFGNGALRDMAWLSLRSVTEPYRLEPALANLTLVLVRPDFPKNAFDRERKRMLIGLREQRESPGTLAKKAFYRDVFTGHPYASDPGGVAASLKTLNRADVAVFHARYYVARNAIISLVGAINRQQAEVIAERLVGQLPAGEHAPALPPVPPLTQSGERRIAHPSAQTHILVGQPGMSRHDPDYFPLYVGNHALGGSGLVSILGDEIREKRGLSYSVYSYFLPMRSQGPFIAGLQTRNDQAQHALKLLREVLARYIKEGPTAAQLLASKQNIIGGFPLRIDSNRKLTEHLTAIGFYGLPLDYLDTFTHKIEIVTRHDIIDALQRRLTPETMITVIVGGDVSTRQPSQDQADQQ